MPAKKTVSTTETKKAAVNTEEAKKNTTVEKTTAKKTTTKAALKKATAKKAADKKETVEKERKNYNQTAKEYNTSVRVFPKSLIAGIFGFKTKGYFEAAEGASQAPVVEF